MLLALAGNWDATAIGTLTLAIVIGVSLAFGWGSLRQGQREVEEAHRPALVPLADSRRIVVEGPKTAYPMHIRVDELLVPIENIGTGPALHVEAAAELLNENGSPTAGGIGHMEAGVIAGIRAADYVAPSIKIRGLTGVPGFWLTLTYEDVAGKGWITKARYIATDRRYTDVTVNTQEEGAYGLRKDSKLAKTV